MFKYERLFKLEFYVNQIELFPCNKLFCEVTFSQVIMDNGVVGVCSIETQWLGDIVSFIGQYWRLLFRLIPRQNAIMTGILSLPLMDTE